MVCRRARVAGCFGAISSRRRLALPESAYQGQASLEPACQEQGFLEQACQEPVFLEARPESARLPVRLV